MAAAGLLGAGNRSCGNAFGGWWIVGSRRAEVGSGHRQYQVAGIDVRWTQRNRGAAIVHVSTSDGVQEIAASGRGVAIEALSVGGVSASLRELDWKLA